MFSLHLIIFNVPIHVECSTEDIADIIRAGFSAFMVEPATPVLHYTLSGDIDVGFIVNRDGVEPMKVDSRYELLYVFEKDMTVELELQRKDLFFIHGAAITLDNKAIMISAPSGSGKSTTTWALLHHGFDYMSDELAPIELESLNVLPFPHALNQKRPPPAPYLLPENVMQTEYTLHIPVEALPCNIVQKPTPLVAMFYVKYNPDAVEPSITPLSISEGCMYLFANGLNQLQHENKGLATATDIAQRVPAFRVETAGLQASALMLRDFVTNL
ncbi:MAG: hypothetical protein COC05_02890 [Gammaproteobacteria bacterium]|nr:MAG: hypothetical protein COC05_02890 [Gammaproteobacteria bacterium]